MDCAKRARGMQSRTISYKYKNGLNKVQNCGRAGESDEENVVSLEDTGPPSKDYVPPAHRVSEY